MTRHRILLPGLFIVLFLYAGPAWSYTMDDIGTWVGQGDNEVGVIIDFNDGSGTDSFAWGYRYDDAIDLSGMSSMERSAFFTTTIMEALVDTDADLSGTPMAMGTSGHNIWSYLNYMGHEQSSSFFEPGMWYPLISTDSVITDESDWFLVDSKKLDPGDQVSWLAIGFYDGQGPVVYSDLVSEPAGSDPVPEPGTAVLLMAGILCISGLGRKKGARC